MPWAVVTGASRHLGRALACMLACEGYDLFLHYHKDRAAIEETADLVKKCGVKVIIHQANFNELDSVFSLVENIQNRCQSLKVVVNNVGSYEQKTLSDSTIKDVNDACAQGIEAPFLLIQGCLEKLMATRGLYLAIGVVGIEKRFIKIDHPLYLLSKNSTLQLIRSFAKEISPKVRFNMISPGHLEHSVNYEKGKGIPITKETSVVEVARFLLSEAGEQITGQNIEVSSGFGV